jgi:coenzyme F420-reducing hydrogenase beta subunit
LVDSKEKKDCCGCRACEQICPKRAIRMAEDQKGFRYPAIDYGICNQCGLCDDICAFNGNYHGYGDDPVVYAVKNKDEDVRRSSTSGGMFAAMSDKTLEDGGVIYGAGYRDRLRVCHKRAATKKERDELKGSKYVQSDIGNNFVQVRQDLEDNQKVLFTGTPCQVAALRSFLRRDYDNLFVADLVCHGVPSDKLWQDFLDVIEKDTADKVVYAEFRNKERSWHAYKTRLYLEKKPTIRIKGEQSYFQLFMSNYMLMPACHNCKFANLNRASDITIGDFWGIERTMPEFDDDKGVSLVLVNSDKGIAMFETVRKSLDVRESCKQNCLQRNLQNPPPMHENSDRFWSDYHRRGMRYVMIKYTDYSDIRTFFRKATRKIGRILKGRP